MIAVAVSLATADSLAAIQITVSVDTLKGELLSRPPAIGLPGFIQPWGDYLLVSDWQGDPNFHALDRETGELIVSFGRIGPGPGEFANMPVGIQMLPHDTSTVWVFDARRLTRIEEPGPIASDVAVVDLTAVPTLLHAAWLDSATIIGVNLRPAAKRFVFFDGAGNVTRTVPGVLLGHDGIPTSLRVDASLNFSFCVNPQGTGFAVLYKTAAKVEIYDRTATHVVDAAVPFSTGNLFDRVDGVVRFVPERFTYSSCWASADGLYALYSGGDYYSMDMNESIGQEIHVFDWKTGGLVRQLYLDVPMLGFSVVEESGWLYAGSLADAGIYRFRLPVGGRE